MNKPNTVNVSQCFAEVLNNPRLECAFKEIISHAYINQDASSLLSKYAHILYTLKDFKTFVTFLRILKSDIIVREVAPNVDFFNLTPTTPLNRFNIVINRLIDNGIKPLYNRSEDIQKLVLQSSGFQRKVFSRQTKHNLIAEAIHNHTPLITPLLTELMKFKMLALVALELSQTHNKCTFANLKYSNLGMV